MALFTACRPAMCRMVLERFGLAELFGQVVYAEEIGLEKRNPQCFVELGRRLGAPLEECTLFDDSPDNYAGRQDELRSVCARYVESLEELLDGPG